MNGEKARLKGEKNWKKWGPYLTLRQWGTVREDYSPNGDAWLYSTHDMARSKAYRWGEEGIAGICDENQLICFALSFWNTKDPILKERFFGLTNQEGNHGEDVKEYYYYLDNTPTHSYMKMLYKYPQQEFPYSQLLSENKKRSKKETEYELIDTGIFDEDKYFDIFVEYAKADVEDIMIKITIFNRSSDTSPLFVIPQTWFRNTWAWGYDNYKPTMFTESKNLIEIEHRNFDKLFIYFDGNAETFFCDNETNIKRLYNVSDSEGFYKDGINDFIVNRTQEAINQSKDGTKAAILYKLNIPPKNPQTIKLRLTSKKSKTPLKDFDNIFNERIAEANEFYNGLDNNIKNKELKLIKRQAFAGLLWNKQFYYYNIPQWLDGDPAMPSPPKERLDGRNSSWFHLNNMKVISIPDKWEFPWYASWDLAFHCIAFAEIDPEFAKKQLILFTHEWYMHPNGQLPAYEWNFGDANPPVHAWASWRVYKIDKKLNDDKGDIQFLESVFHKLLLNFTWWVNRKDRNNRNIFEGGFLGLDNIGVFDRSKQFLNGERIEQADATSWMAMYCLNMMRISLELAGYNSVYEDMATKFFEHFLYIAGAMVNIGEKGIELWDDKDEFFYDVLHMPNGSDIRLRIHSIVGLIPLFAVEILEDELLHNVPRFEEKLKWFLNYRSDLANLVSRWQEHGNEERRLLSLLRGHRMKCLLRRMLDENEFLSDYGVRALSKFHKDNPFTFETDGSISTVSYQPGESDSNLFGGNSNWRGPIWIPINFMIIESLEKFHYYYGDDFKVEYPTRSGNYLTLNEISIELTKRLLRIFQKDDDGFKPFLGDNQKLQSDPNFNDYFLFNEYFHGDTGKGLGASHQTGWTSLIAKLIQPSIK
jgi:Mannosylglycerate hydrolase MGH1-like glycoside hydrolase domain/Glycosyl hydrolase family 63 C-terminal domain